MQINERILNDSEFLCKLNLSELRLIKDGELDWFVLIPLREDKVEICELNQEDQIELMHEMTFLSTLLKESGAYKVNVGALGNVVSQLHIHVIGRMENDRAWPGPIWGTSSQVSFDQSKVGFWKEKVMKKRGL